MISRLAVALLSASTGALLAVLLVGYGVWLPTVQRLRAQLAAERARAQIAESHAADLAATHALCRQSWAWKIREVAHLQERAGYWRAVSRGEL